MGRPLKRDMQVLPDHANGVQLKTSDIDPRFNNALARGLAILRSFQFDEQLLSNQEISEKLGLPRSTVSRLTHTLSQLGCLAYRSDFGKYELAAGVVGLASPYLAGMVLPAVAKPLMDKVALSTGAEIALGVQESLTVTYLECAGFEPPRCRRRNIGTRVPLAYTAAGRACVAAMSPGRRRLLYELLSSNYRREWSRLHEEVESSIEQVDRRGFCVVTQPSRQGTISAAAPFFPSDSGAIYAFSLQVSLRAPSAAMMERNGWRLVELVSDVRRKLAAPPSTQTLGWI